ncbi:MAG: hypothetical protein S0880_04405 [Actinomycetota bacterium]|nr:hypothetical protein [Actinomycetota bacterium]
MTGDELLDDREIATLRAELDRRAAEIDVPADLRAAVDRRHRSLRHRRTAARTTLRAAIVVVVAAVAVGGWWATDERSDPGTFVDLDRAGDVTTPSDGATPNDGQCETLVGPEPWITLFEAQPAAPCVIVGEFQDVQVWNKGFDTITVEWVDGEHRLGPDQWFATGPIGEVLEPGDHTFESSPYAMPTIRVLAREDRPVDIDLAWDIFGPVTPGTTVEEAVELLGVPFEETDRFDGNCVSVISGDPYSPLFIVTEDDAGAPTIADIVDPRHLDDLGQDPCNAPGPLPEGVPLLFATVTELDPSVPFTDDAVLLVGDVHRQPLTDPTDRTQWVADVELFNGASGPIDVLARWPDVGGGVQLVEGPVRRCGVGDPLTVPELDVEVRHYSATPVGTDSCLQWFSFELFVDAEGRIAAVRYDHWEP